MPIELSAERAVCYRCGQAYGRKKGNFPVSYAVMHKGVGYTPICKTCVDALYNAYLAQCNSSKLAVRQVCRKLDIYFNESAYELVERKSTTRTMMTQYIQKVNSISYANKSYDDTLSEEGTLWAIAKPSDIIEMEAYERAKQDLLSSGKISIAASAGDDQAGSDDGKKEHSSAISDEVKAYWGGGYTDEMYEALENRLAYWKSKYPDGYEFDAGTESLLQQICGMELDINRDRADGKSVDKSVSTLNSLLGSLNLKPVQRNQDDGDASLAKVPLGVWLYRYENKRPLPEDKSDNKILKYVFTWLGHVCKMLGVKNGYEQMYEDEVSKYRVEMPEYDGDDDEAFMTHVFESEAVDDEQV